ncbi:hypothetical protein A9G42_07335 [Gilliamella sp. Nev6-6]|uniref:hypothetical protein n=1 Tax=Gilliamella sp. Nev6-6 TaxID=3120252 RepID=UPI00080F3C95|nr:hypothetical protein [Gilliamella apicola]OCG76734.1 hypothetical protein A9G42_07335 [Gilliamella apicola]
MYELKKLCHDLHLPSGDKFTQDWAYELPEQYRTEEWLDRYIRAYTHSTYSKTQKRILMTLILDVTNDLVSSGISVSTLTINQALKLLLQDYHYHMELIEYWSLSDEPLADCFALTPEIRKLKMQLTKK